MIIVRHRRTVLGLVAFVIAALVLSIGPGPAEAATDTVDESFTIPGSIVFDTDDTLDGTGTVSSVGETGASLDASGVGDVERNVNTTDGMRARAHVFCWKDSTETIVDTYLGATPVEFSEEVNFTLTFDPFSDGSITGGCNVVRVRWNIALYGDDAGGTPTFGGTTHNWTNYGRIR